MKIGSQPVSNSDWPHGNTKHTTRKHIIAYYNGIREIHHEQHSGKAYYGQRQYISPSEQIFTGTREKGRTNPTLSIHHRSSQSVYLLFVFSVLVVVSYLDSLSLVPPDSPDPEELPAPDSDPEDSSSSSLPLSALDFDVTDFLDLVDLALSDFLDFVVSDLVDFLDLADFLDFVDFLDLVVADLVSVISSALVAEASADLVAVVSASADIDTVSSTDLVSLVSTDLVVSADSVSEVAAEDSASVTG